MSPRRVFALSYSSATVTFARPLFRHIARRSSVIVEVALRDSVVARTGPSAEGVRDPKLQHSRRPILPSLFPPPSSILGLSAFRTVSLKKGGVGEREGTIEANTLMWGVASYSLRII